MNRHNNFAIIYSPEDKANIKNHYQATLKVLNKNCDKFIIAYEEGKTQSNPHLDIVACFKSKQARNDLSKKFSFLGTKPQVVYSVINDLPYRIGYNQKEKTESPLNHIFNFTDSDIEAAVEHYISEEQSRKLAKKKYNLFTYIKESTFAYEFNKFVIQNKIIEPITQSAYEKVLSEMYISGYIFTTIKKSSLAIIGRQIIAVYRNKLEMEPGENSYFNQIILTDLALTDVSSKNDSNLCCACQSKILTEYPI